MISKIEITEKLNEFLIQTNTESIIKVLIISFLYDKCRYMEKDLKDEEILKMLDIWIYNLTNNIKSIRSLENHKYIYSKYEFKSKTLIYNINDNYQKIKTIKKDEQKKQTIILEFKLMIYKELERVINLVLKKDIILDGIYSQEVLERRNLKYDNFYSDMSDAIAENEVCNICNIKDKIIKYIDVDKQYFVYTNHLSQRNMEIMGYIQLLKEIFKEDKIYLAIREPNVYTNEMISNFNMEYNWILKKRKELLFKEKDILKTIEVYLMHIRNQVNIHNNVKYHQDISFIFYLIYSSKNNKNIEEYLLHSIDEYKYILNFKGEK